MANQIESRKRSSLQRLLRGVAWLLGGLLATGAVLDAVSNARSLITTRLASVLTAIVVLAWGGAEIFLRLRPTHWLSRDQTVLRVSSFGWQPRIMILGLLVLLWLPSTIEAIVPSHPVGVLPIQATSLGLGPEAASLHSESHAGNYRAELSLEDAVKQGDMFLYRKHKFEEAEQSYALALSIDPRNATIWRRKGIAIVARASGTTQFADCIADCRSKALETFLRALPAFTRALQLDPNDKEALLYRGLVYYRWGNLANGEDAQNALSQFEAAVALTPPRHVNETKWDYETSCAHYGIAIVFARLWQQDDRADTKRQEEHMSDVKKALQRSSTVVPTCASPNTTIDQLLSVTEKIASDPSWTYSTPPDPFWSSP